MQQKLKKPGVVTDDETLELLRKSSEITNKNHNLSMFWNNTSMARVLDIFLENKDSWINITDMINVGDLSRQSIRVNTDLLMEMGIIEKKVVKYYAFFRWNKKSPQAKHLDKLSSIIS